jgi:excinuclease ABC subunit C
VLLRRMAHPEWKYPDLIIVDGGAIQLEAAYSVIRESGLIIPIAAVIKDDKHKAKAVLGLPAKGIKGISQESIAKDCMNLNAETHRFAIKYHRSKRNILS